MIDAALKAQTPNAPTPLQAWVLATRPYTLTVSLSPVILGAAIAWHDIGHLLPWPLFIAIAASLFIQAGTNLFNDAGDFLRGADPPERLGPPRATAQGWLTARQVQTGAWLAFALAFVCGIYLVSHGGWPIVIVGLASLAAGWAYTWGPAPIAYRPYGEVFVWLFFGLIAVSGSYYLQTLTLSFSALAAAALVGLHAAAVITVNNYRDLEGDAKHGKNTLAVRLGRPATRRLYAAEMLLPYAGLLLLAPALGLAAALPLLSLPAGVALVRRFTRQEPGRAFNRILAATAGLQLIFALLLAAAFISASGV